jgi:hypothetical protein
MHRQAPPFEQAGGGAVRLQVGAVDDQAVGLAGLAGQRGEDAAEHAHAAYRPAGVA